MAKPTPKTRAPRRSAEQIARDELAMTEKKLEQVLTRISRLDADLAKANAECGSLERLRDYQAAHPLLAQEALPVGGDTTA